MTRSTARGGAGRNAFFYDNHYRRFSCAGRADRGPPAGRLPHRVRQGTDRLRPYGNDDPPVIRVVAVKN